MIWFLKKRNEPGHVSHLHSMLTTAFSHVKRDIHVIISWLNYFHRKHQEHDKRFQEIESQLSQIPKSPEQIKQIIDYYYSYENVLQKIHELRERMDSIEAQKQVSTVERKHHLKERLIKKITKNSKDYVKSVILSTIKKYQKIPASEIKEMVVDEQGLCSKSSFYRLLQELEISNDIDVIHQGKEKIYISKLAAIN